MNTDTLTPAIPVSTRRSPERGAAIFVRLPAARPAGRGQAAGRPGGGAGGWVISSLACLLIWALLLAACASEARVGALQTESQAVELGDAEAVRVEIVLGAGDLVAATGAEKLLEADCACNVARLKPEENYADGTLVVRKPDTRGMPAL